MKMKKRKKLSILFVLLFVCLGIGMNFLFSYILKKDEERKNIAANRLVAEVNERYAATRYSDETNVSEENEMIDHEKMEDNETVDHVAMRDNESVDHMKMKDVLNEVFYNKLDEWRCEYGADQLPSDIQFLDAHERNENISLLNPGEKEGKLWGIYSGDELAGFLLLSYPDCRIIRLRYLMNGGLIIVFLFCMLSYWYVQSKILRPFEMLSNYPERLSKNQISDKLPESKSRFFGKFVWGLNMLSDRMQNDKNRIDKMGAEKQTMLTTIAHGIKTPLANIKLYANAIEMGLYQPDGMPDESDAKIAEKISKNADEATELVKNLLETTSQGLVDFEPDEQWFYLRELKNFLQKEYENRLSLLRIPYSFDLESDVMIKSDKTGICRVLTQLLENAIKYGNGEGIRVNIAREEDGYYILVVNKGKTVEEKELPYLFNSFWRGSNATGVEGSGIGLFESRSIMKKLNGDLYARINTVEGEMEFTMYLPLQ